MTKTEDAEDLGQQVGVATEHDYEDWFARPTIDQLANDLMCQEYEHQGPI